MSNKRFYSLLILPFALNACSNDKELMVIPFNLNESREMFNPPTISLIKNKTEFDSFLEDDSIFTDNASEEFADINKKYTTSFFEYSDLTAVIYQATSSMIYGYALDKISKDGSFLIVSINSLCKKKIVTTDMGAFFTYYFETKKDETIIDAKLKVDGYLISRYVGY